MKRFQTVDKYISGNKEWNKELKKLRKIILKSELKEDVKWGAPVYTIDNKNVVGIGAFKSYVGIWFFQGALLKDKRKKLVSAQEGLTKALRQWRFDTIDEIDEKLILEYIKEAIKNQKAGKEIKPVKKSAIKIPKELSDKLKKNQKLKKSLEQLTPFKQREYCDYIDSAKREETKLSRLEKIIPMILQGVGLHDKYR
ncbi:MAG: YdeI/OmpD-associated family protein [Ignavibacterium sp.]|nr:MAG: YdeI/OmpD-associated family protein [Ignavibacterium sp.]